MNGFAAFPRRAAGALGLLWIAAACSLAPGVPTPPSPAPSRARPNILLIVADDLGYADLGVYGSEIETPNIDRLAREGVQFSNFHAAATCSPSRAMLLSGIDNHLAGLGGMETFLTDEQRGRPGYEGELNEHVVAVSQRLRDAGYETYFAGKWHLGTRPGSWPFDRGFVRSFALLDGSSDNYSDRGPAPVLPRTTFVEDDHRVQRDARHSSELYTDRLLSYLGAEPGRDAPFFAVLSFQAVHWPHQAPARYIEKYREVYEAGWDVLRRTRLERQKKLALVPADFEPTPRHAWAPAWNALEPDRRQRLARHMAAYAGMLEHMDHEVGRLLDHLRRTGVLDDTLVVFLSDNGPDPSRPDHFPQAGAWYAQHYRDDSIEGIGGRDSFSSYGPGWAQLGTTFLRDFKGSACEGGLRVPLILRDPRRIEAGTRSDVFAYVTDIVPTLLEAAGVDAAAQNARGADVYPLTGKSLWPVLDGRASALRGPDEALGYELMKTRALFLGDLKLVRNGPPTGSGAWELFDLRADPAERRDLSSSLPRKREEMLRRFDAYVESHGIILMSDDYDVMKELTRSR